MELATYAERYRNFYAPAFSVRVGGSDLLRDLNVAVAQIEVDMVFGAASRFNFTVCDCYCEKLHALKTGRGKDLLKILTFGAETQVYMGYGDAKSTPIAMSGMITEITTNFPEGGAP